MRARHVPGTLTLSARRSTNRAALIVFDRIDLEGSVRPFNKHPSRDDSWT